MTVEVTPGQSFIASTSGALESLVGTITVAIYDPLTATYTSAAHTSGITEVPADSGSYFATLTAPANAGTYSIMWDDGPDVVTEDLVVGPDPDLPIATDLCTLADVRLAERLEADEDTDRDELRQTYITDGSQVIEDWCGREFSDRGTLTRQFAYRGTKSLMLAPYDLRAAASLTIDGATFTQDADYYLEPLPSKNGTYQRVDFATYPYSTLTLNSIYWRTRPRRVVEIAGTWGMASVPRDVKRATVETVKAWMHKAPLDGLDGNGEARTVGDGTRGLDLPWAARKLLSNYRVRAGS